MATTIKNSNAGAISASENILYKIQISDESTSVVPSLQIGDNKVYQIDLNTRTVEQPDDYVIVETDHASETIYFKAPRYFDNMDLTETVCIIQYINAKNEQYIYAVPYYDVDTFAAEHVKSNATDKNGQHVVEDPQIVIPWKIAGTAAEKAGNVTFSIRFYKYSDTGAQLFFNLSTLQQTLKITAGLGINFQKATSDATWMDSVDDSVKQSYDYYFATAAALASQGALYWEIV